MKNTVKKELTHLSLFTGIGGLDLAAEWVGIESIGQCEYADYPTKVLEKYWPDVERWKDIRTLTKESFYERTGRRTVDIISGGFPCQPFSVAGKQRGKEDDRFLWPEMVRVIKELGPTWVVGENVAGIIRLALDDVLSDLEREGYTTRTFLIPACGVGAPHQRYRTAIVAHAQGERIGRVSVQQRGSQQKGSDIVRSSEDVADSKSNTERRLSIREKAEKSRSGGSSEDVAHTDSPGRTKQQYATVADSQGFSGRRYHEGWERREERWAVEPNVGRVANGVPFRVDRLRCLGNAVVPQQFFPVFEAIAEIESGG